MVNKNYIQFKKNIDGYILELKKFTGIDIEPEFLSSIEDMEKIRRKSSSLKNNREKTFTIQFEEKNTKKFIDFVAKLYCCNSNPVYVWTEKTNKCGLFKIDSVLKFNFSFEFDINCEGIVVLLTENLCDKLILDYYENYTNEKLLDVTLQGRNWYSVAY